MQQIETVNLYHGTSSCLMDKILIEGLRPRSQTGIENWPGINSQPELVFLASTPQLALHFSKRTIINHKGHPMIIQVRVDQNKLKKEIDGTKFDPIALSEEWRCGHFGSIPIENFLQTTEYAYDFSTEIKHTPSKHFIKHIYLMLSWLHTKQRGLI